MAEIKEPSDVLFQGQAYKIGLKVYYVKKWTVRMVLVDVPQVISRFYERLRASQGESIDYGNLASALQLSAEEIAYLIGKSLEPQLSTEEVMDLPAEVGTELLRIIIEQNAGFFSQLINLFRSFRAKLQDTQSSSQT